MNLKCRIHQLLLVLVLLPLLVLFCLSCFFFVWWLAWSCTWYIEWLWTVPTRFCPKFLLKCGNITQFSKQFRWIRVIWEFGIAKWQSRKSFFKSILSNWICFLWLNLHWIVKIAHRVVCKSQNIFQFEKLWCYSHSSALATQQRKNHTPFIMLL